MNADFLKTNLHFKEGIKGSYYKKIDGFLYTVDPTDDSEIFLYVNLPEADEESKHAFIEFLKDSLKNFVKARIVKNGIKITLTPDAFKKKSFITNTAKTISQYFKDKNIAFPDKKHPIDYKNNMYVFVTDDAIDTVEAEIEAEVITEEAQEVIAMPAIEEADDNETPSEAPSETPSEEPEKEKKCSIKKFFSSFIGIQISIIFIYLLFGVVFILLSSSQISIAAICGYFMGWLPAEILVKRKSKNSTIFLTVSFFSLLALSLAGTYVFLQQFLSQTQIYTASEFFLQSLTPSHCIFNVVLGLLLSMFGTYSTLPAQKKKEKAKDVDFE